MSQQEVYTIFKKFPGRWLSARNISDILDGDMSTVQSAIRRLRKHEEIDWRVSGNHMEYRLTQ